MAPFLFGFVGSTLLINAYGQTQTCRNLNSATCLVDCNADHGCEDYFLYCRAGVPCVIDCSHEEACEGATIDARDATDVTINCDYKSESCYQSTIRCGTGKCLLFCGSYSQSCDKATLDLGRATSFQCTGDCPFSDWVATPNDPNDPQSTPSPLAGAVSWPELDPNSTPNPTISQNTNDNTPSSTQQLLPTQQPTSYLNNQSPGTNIQILSTSTTSTTQLQGIFGRVDEDDFVEITAVETPSPVGGGIFADLTKNAGDDGWLIVVTVAGIGGCFCLALMALGFIAIKRMIKKKAPPTYKVYRSPPLPPVRLAIQQVNDEDEPINQPEVQEW